MLTPLPSPLEQQRDGVATPARRPPRCLAVGRQRRGKGLGEVGPELRRHWPARGGTRGLEEADGGAKRGGAEALALALLAVRRAVHKRVRARLQQERLPGQPLAVKQLLVKGQPVPRRHDEAKGERLVRGLGGLDERLRALDRRLCPR